jgi:hypothetical protein
LLVLAAILARCAAVLVLQSHNVPRSTYEHGEIAAKLLAGRGFAIHFLGADGPTSQQAPIYPLIVAGAYAIGGVETPKALLLLELAQAVLGGSLVLGVMRLARSIAPENRASAFLAGALAAFHPTLVYAATHVQVGGLATTLLVWTLVAAYRAGHTGRSRNALLTGVLLALLTLTDPILGLVFPGLVVAIALGRHAAANAYRQTAHLAVLTAIAGAVGIAPWLIRNYLVHGELVLIKSTFGYAFWQGNCRLSEGTDKVVRASVDRAVERGRAANDLRGWNRSLWEARHQAGYIDDIALSRDEVKRLGCESEPERSRILFRRALGDLAAEPGRYGRLCLRRLRYFLLFDETNPKSRSLIYRVSHVALSAIALAGLSLVGRGPRRQLAPTILTAVLITLFHSLTIVSARFHLPLEPLFAIWGAVGLAPLPALAWHSWRRYRSTTVAGDVERIGLEDRLGGLELAG